MAGRQSDPRKRGKTPSTADSLSPSVSTGAAPSEREQREKRARQAAGGGKRRELTCVSFVIFPDGRTAPVKELTEEERAQWHRNMSERLSEAMSDYYTQRPDEYARL